MEPLPTCRTKRWITIRRRIASNIGHLSNANTMAVLEELLAPNTKHLDLARISRKCNDYQLVSKLTEARLAELHREDLAFHLAKQDTPLDTFCLE